MFPNEDISAVPWLLKDGGCLDMDAFPDCWEKRTHLERYAFACKAFSGMRILDFGCGMGYGSEMLLKAGNQVTALDISEEALEMAEERRGNLSEDLKFCNSVPHDLWFDGCTAFEVVEHLENPEEFIDTVKARHLIASVPVVPTVGHNPYHTRDYTVESFRELMSRRFDIRYWWIQVRPYMNFPSVVIMHGELKN